jgi:hypothetical protein
LEPYEVVTGLEFLSLPHCNNRDLGALDLSQFFLALRRPDSIYLTGVTELNPAKEALRPITAECHARLAAVGKPNRDGQEKNTLTRFVIPDDQCA